MERIEKLVRGWFDGMDRMTDNTFFHSYIDNTTVFTTPEGSFRGIEGFDNWYNKLKTIVKPDNEHKITDIRIKPLEDKEYRVEIDVEVRADTYDGNGFNIRAKEVWKVEVKDALKILEYGIVEIESL